MRYFYLPDSAFKINHSHNLDINSQNDSFYFHKNDLPKLIESCQKQNDNEYICHEANLNCNNKDQFPDFCKGKEKYSKMSCYQLRIEQKENHFFAKTKSNNWRNSCSFLLKK